MKSYYISSINLWVLGVCGVVSQGTKEKIRTEFKKQVSTAKDVVVLDEWTAPLIVVESSKSNWETGKIGSAAIKTVSQWKHSFFNSISDKTNSKIVSETNSDENIFEKNKKIMKKFVKTI